MSKIKINRNNSNRILLTELLPYEVPMLFSNDGFYSIIAANKHTHFFDKVNVSKRLAEIGKKSLADEKLNMKNNTLIKKMNEAAMKSYMRDISEGSDMTSRYFKIYTKNINIYNIFVTERSTK